MHTSFGWIKHHDVSIIEDKLSPTNTSATEAEVSGCSIEWFQRRLNSYTMVEPMVERV